MLQLGRCDIVTYMRQKLIISFILNNGISVLSLVALLSYVIVILVSIISHEVAHGYVAYLNGDPTAKLSGRLTLNPAKHLTLAGTLMMFLVGFGWAKPVPIDSRNFKDYKKGMITTSLAGVTLNFIYALLSSICLAILLLCTKNVVFYSKNFAFYAYAFGYYLFYFSMMVNVTLMVFNLLPIYPLDGFRVVETLSSPDSKFVDFMYRYGSFVLLAFIIISYGLSYLGVPSLFAMVQQLTATIFDKLWGAIMGVALI